MKTCTWCKQPKPSEDFSTRKQSKDGLHCWCRPCLKAKKKADYEKHKDKRAATMRAWVEANRDRYEAVKKACVERNRARYAAVKKEWRERQGDILVEKKAAYRAANRETLNRKQREYYRKNKETHNQKSLEYIKRRYKSDPMFALASLYRGRVKIAFKKQGFPKDSPTQRMLGCTFQELMVHLESQFQPGMTWENRALHGWHIDHKIPLASAKTQEELEALCHYTNLQPLWAKDNYTKGAKMPGEQTA